MTRNQERLLILARLAEEAQGRVNDCTKNVFPVGTEVDVPRRLAGIDRTWACEVIGYTSPSKRRNLVLKVIGSESEIFQYAISVKTLLQLTIAS